MSDDKDNDLLNSVAAELDWTIDNVIKRGYSDIDEKYDDYRLLIEKNDYRNLIVLEIYENYFLPKRHEFELQILNTIVEAVVQYQPWSYAAGAAISGIIGNATYDLIKKLCKYVSLKFKNKDDKRSRRFLSISNDIEKIEVYFKKKKSARIEEIENELKIDRQKLVPLLKLLGFKCTRTGKKRWIKP